MKATLWITSEFSQQDFMRAETDEARIKECFVSLKGTDMTSNGWTLVGEAEVEAKLFPSEELLASAVAAIDAQMAAVDRQYEATIDRLVDLKRNLLCLPAPTTLTEAAQNV